MSSMANEASLCLTEQKPYIKTVHAFILLGNTSRHVKSAPVPAFIASRFVFIFLRFLKKKKKKKKEEITDAVTHLLVLPLALMENVKGAQPRWGQADIASERGGQVTKQMFTVFLRMICSLLDIDSGPTITQVSFTERRVGVGRRGHNARTRC